MKIKENFFFIENYQLCKRSQQKEERSEVSLTVLVIWAMRDWRKLKRKSRENKQENWKTRKPPHLTNLLIYWSCFHWLSSSVDVTSFFFIQNFIQIYSNLFLLHSHFTQTLINKIVSVYYINKLFFTTFIKVRKIKN